MLHRKLIVYDFETDGVDDLVQPVQVAALAIDLRMLQIIPDSEFVSMMKPDFKERGLESWEAYKANEKIAGTAAWHGKNYGKTADEIFEIWENAPEQQHVWNQFHTYINKYNVKKTLYNAPIAGGMNIRGFDNVIRDRLNTKYGIETMFWNRDCVDLQDMAFLWLLYRKDCPTNFKMDTLRPYFGISNEGSHDALMDVRQTAEILIRFMKLHREFCQKVNFAGALANVNFQNS